MISYDVPDSAGATARAAGAATPQRGRRRPSQQAVIYLTLAILTAATVALLALGVLPTSVGPGGGCGGG